MVGGGLANVATDDVDSRSGRPGLGVGVGGGYDLWIADQVSVGALGRLLYVAGYVDELGTHHAIIPTLSLTYVYH
jgi:hypothetical protein